MAKSSTPAPVLCLLCQRPCKSPTARARRVGGRCWRKLRRQARVTGQSTLFDVELSGVC